MVLNVKIIHVGNNPRTATALQPLGMCPSHAIPGRFSSDLQYPTSQCALQKFHENRAAFLELSRQVTAGRRQEHNCPTPGGGRGRRGTGGGNFVAPDSLASIQITAENLVGIKEAARISDHKLKPGTKPHGAKQTVGRQTPHSQSDAGTTYPGAIGRAHVGI